VVPSAEATVSISELLSSLGGRRGTLLRPVSRAGITARATVGYGAVVKAAPAIAPYLDGFSMNNVRPSDPRMIGFLQALSQTSSS
jgi:hypothetical protein